MEAKQVKFTTQDRQWDARINVQTDADVERLLTAIRGEWDAGKFRYILVGGVEVGTRPMQDDYQVRHVHVAAIFNNRVTKASIIKNWNIIQGNGYYLVPRNRNLPYSGWRTHHTKEFSKIDKGNLILFEEGELPKDESERRPALGAEEKKRKIDEVLIEMRGLIEDGREDEAFRKFPRNYLQYGEKIKALTVQKRDFFKTGPGNPHIWLHGYAGEGKTSLLQMVYPNTYKKNLYNKFFDLYDPSVHTHVILEDLDHEAVERLSVNFLKTLCDEAGFAVDQKYKTPQLSKTTVLVSSNFTIQELLSEGPGSDKNISALNRRFWHVNANALHRLLGIKLKPKWALAQLKKEGNTDPRQVFLAWDWLTDTPTGEELKSPEEYQEIIRNYYYK